MYLPAQSPTSMRTLSLELAPERATEFGQQRVTPTLGYPSRLTIKRSTAAYSNAHPSPLYDEVPLRMHVAMA